MKKIFKILLLLNSGILLCSAGYIGDLPDIEAVFKDKKMQKELIPASYKETPQDIKRLQKIQNLTPKYQKNKEEAIINLKADRGKNSKIKLLVSAEKDKNISKK